MVEQKADKAIRGQEQEQSILGKKIFEMKEIFRQRTRRGDFK